MFSKIAEKLKSPASREETLKSLSEMLHLKSAEAALLPVDHLLKKLKSYWNNASLANWNTGGEKQAMFTSLHKAWGKVKNSFSSDKSTNASAQEKQEKHTEAHKATRTQSAQKIETAPPEAQAKTQQAPERPASPAQIYAAEFTRLEKMVFSSQDVAESLVALFSAALLMEAKKKQAPQPKLQK
ncbi:hypothetical protein FAI40_03880 [Acetobacteraceae bacterium]|nr:hypothetical protein FAI40_03880 [Acetobacteraceae bacterium]